MYLDHAWLVVSEHVRLPLNLRLTRLGCCRSGEAVIGGVVAALAVKVSHITTSQAAACAQQEVQALQDVCGKDHILQYVHHAWTNDKNTLLLSTR